MTTIGSWTFSCDLALHEGVKTGADWLLALPDQMMTNPYASVACCDAHLAWAAAWLVTNNDPDTDRVAGVTIRRLTPA